jgi:tetratricopeptide (TPR) repeat protein
MNLEKLKDAARKHEQREDWRKAIDAYQRVIQHYDSGREADADLTIYNRVGDLYLKLNDPGSAVQSYERAAELYAEQGFLNNAIALCGKVLRVNPGRVQVYLQLAHLHARKTVVSEAKRNLIEYMERMNTLGKLDEAFGQVKAFADQHSANQDIRLMLVELLRAASRTEEAQEQLERIASELEARGDRAGARKTRERIHAIDSQEDDPSAGKNDLIFLETGFEPPHLSPRRPAAAPEAGPEPLPAAAPVEGLESVGGAPQAEPVEAEPAPMAGLDTFEPPAIATETVEAGALADLQPSSFEPTPQQVDVPPLDGLLLDRPEDEGVFPSLESALDDAPLSLDAAMAQADENELVSLDSALAGDATTDDTFTDDALTDDSLSGSVRFLDDFDVGEPIELQSRRSDSDELVEHEEPMLPSESAAEAMPPGAAWQEPAEPVQAAAEPAPAAPGKLLDTSSELSQLDVEDLEDRILDDPDSAILHRALGDRLARDGDLGRAVEEYLLGIAAFERDEAWLPALDAVDALLALEPDAIRNQQKRVELAYRSGDRSRLLGAYMGLAEALVRAEALGKAVAVYQRVLEHDPDNHAAREALAWLDTMSPPVELAEPAPAAPESRPGPGADERSSFAGPPPARTPVVPPASGDFVDLGSLVIDAGGPRDTRMRVDGERPTGDEQKDFQETLEQFKKGIEANLGTEDFEAHYDLGVAFKEMGLLDEAIAEFQKALRAPTGRLRTSEALGVTFYEKEQYAIAETILRRAVDTLEGGDDEKIGLLYWLGRACESQGKGADARQAFERALAVDIRFMDLSERIRKLAVGKSA